MIRKVLITEDHEGVSSSVRKTLEELCIEQIDYVSYYNDALMNIQTARLLNHSYDVLITDLYPENDQQQISDGRGLIAAARTEQPDLKVLVFSTESNTAIIEMLFNELEIDGYVRKARGDARELKKALEHIKAHQRYYPPYLLRQVKQSASYVFTPFDITIISLMTQGKRQQEIADHLKENNMHPSSLSSIEKRLILMKEALNFFTNEQLIAHCVKAGIV